MLGVPEVLLSDRGTNLSCLMKDICQLLGTKKLNTTLYHPQCDGMVERLNRTLKAMLRKHAAAHGNQWDKILPGVLWAYRNNPPPPPQGHAGKAFIFCSGLTVVHPPKQPISPPLPHLRSLLQITAGN